jgi:CheY-like chemotaxis protein
MNVLVIDDELEILELIKEVLISRGYFVTTANSGKVAIEILKIRDFDLVISDFKMPNGNGLTVLNFVNSLSKKPIFFFLSGYSDLSPQDCIKAGANKFFLKPFDLEVLMNEVERIVHDRRI